MNLQITFSYLTSANHAWAEPYYSKAKLYFLQGEVEMGLKYIEMAFTINPAERFEFEFERDWEKVLQFLIARDN